MLPLPPLNSVTRTVPLPPAVSAKPMFVRKLGVDWTRGTCATAAASVVDTAGMNWPYVRPLTIDDGECPFTVGSTAVEDVEAIDRIRIGSVRHLPEWSVIIRQVLQDDPRAVGRNQHDRQIASRRMIDIDRYREPFDQAGVSDVQRRSDLENTV